MLRLSVKLCYCNIGQGTEPSVSNNKNNNNNLSTARLGIAPRAHFVVVAEAKRYFSPFCSNCTISSWGSATSPEVRYMREFNDFTDIEQNNVFFCLLVDGYQEVSYLEPRNNYVEARKWSQYSCKCHNFVTTMKMS